MSKTTDLRAFLVHENPEDADTLPKYASASTRYNMQVNCVRGGADALKRLPNEEYDLLFLDICLDGEQKRRDIIRNVGDETDKTPVLVLTETEDAEWRAQMMQAGVTDYLVKETLTVGKLERAVRRALETQRLTGEQNPSQGRPDAAEDKLRWVCEALPDPVLITDTDGNVLHVNEACMEELECAEKTLVNKNLRDIVVCPGAASLEEHMRAARVQGISIFETTFKGGNGSRVKAELRGFSTEFEGRQAIFFLARDITARSRLEWESRIITDVLRLVNEPDGLEEVLPDIATLMEDWVNCDTVDIWLRPGQQYSCYGSGGSPSWLEEKDRRLCENNRHGQTNCEEDGEKPTCICHRLLRGDIDLNKSCFTENGSFWTNNLSELLQSEYRPTGELGSSDCCSVTDYESVVLIPLRYGQQTLGLLQLKDESSGRFDSETLSLLEHLASNVAVGLAQRRASLSLKRAEERFAAFLNHVPGPAYIYDEKGTIVYANDSYRDAFAPGLSEVKGHHLSEIFSSECVEHLLTQIQDVLEAKGPIEFEKTVQSRCWMSREFPIRTEKEPRMIGGVCFDITDRKRVEKAHRESEDRFRTIVENLPDGVFAHDLDGNLVMVNEAACRDTGYSRDRLLSMSVEDIKAQNGGEQEYEQAWTELEEGESTRLYSEYERKDGSTYPVELTLTAIRLKGEPVILGLAKDITDRKRYEEALQKRTKLLAEAEKMADMGAWEWDVENDRFMFSEEWQRIHGCAASELSMNGLLSVVHPEDRSFVKQAMQEALDENESYDIEHRIIRQDNGEERFIRCRGKVTLDENSDVSGMYGTAQDITEQKRAEEALKDREAQLATIVESVPFVMLLVDKERRVRQINAAGAEFAGREPEELFGLRAGEALRCVYSLDHPQGCGQGPACQDCTIREIVLDTLETKREHERVEVEMTFGRADGNIHRTYLVDTAPVQISDNSMALVVLDDITERKRTEAQLRLRERAIESSLNGVILMDIQGVIEYVNPAAVEMLDFESKSDIVGREVGEIWQSDEQVREALTVTRKENY